MDSILVSMILAVVGGLVLNALLAAALYAWGRWVVRRQGDGKWRYVVRGPLVSFAVSTGGVLLAIVAVVQTVDTIAAVPGHRSRLVLEGFFFAGYAMMASVFGGALLYAASIVALVVGSLLRPRPTLPA